MQSKADEMIQDSKPTVWQRVVKFMTNPRNLFVLGFVIIFVLTLLEVTRDRHGNFKIFAQSTRMFWEGIAPYGDNWSAMAPKLDYFLYGPLFNVLFAPFAFAVELVGICVVVCGDIHSAEVYGGGEVQVVYVHLPFACHNSAIVSV